MIADDRNGKTKPRREPQYFNPVQKECTYAESVNKEKRMMAQFKTGEYSINPFSMPVVTAKPNHITPSVPY
jgi:hypothetical protein